MYGLEGDYIYIPRGKRMEAGYIAEMEDNVGYTFAQLQLLLFMAALSMIGSAIFAIGFGLVCKRYNAFIILYLHPQAACYMHTIMYYTFFGDNVHVHFPALRTIHSWATRGENLHYRCGCLQHHVSFSTLCS